MKEQDVHEYPVNLYNDMYGQIQYEMLESIKDAINASELVISEDKQKLIQEIEEQIEITKMEIKKMIELSNFQYNIREERRRKKEKNSFIKSYYTDYDYGLKPEFKNRLY